MSLSLHELTSEGVRSTALLFPSEGSSPLALLDSGGLGSHESCNKGGVGSNDVRGRSSNRRSEAKGSNNHRNNGLRAAAPRPIAAPSGEVASARPVGLVPRPCSPESGAPRAPRLAVDWIPRPKLASTRPL
jgi:hypothetical protein